MNKKVIIFVFFMIFIIGIIITGFMLGWFESDSKKTGSEEDKPESQNPPPSAPQNKPPPTTIADRNSAQRQQNTQLSRPEIIDKGYPDDPNKPPKRGWYDLTNSGQKNNFCRYIGEINNKQWMCIMSENPTNPYDNTILPNDPRFSDPLLFEPYIDKDLPSTQPPSTEIQISTDGQCGSGNNRRCPDGQCCSQWGWCGTTSENCIQNSNSSFNGANATIQDAPTEIQISTNGICGSSNNKKCPNNFYCSPVGICGATIAHMLPSDNSRFNGTITHNWVTGAASVYTNALAATERSTSDKDNWICRVLLANGEYAIGGVDRGFISLHGGKGQCNYANSGSEWGSGNHELLVPNNKTAVWKNKNETQQNEKILAHYDGNNPFICRIKVKDNPETWRAGSEKNGTCSVGYGNSSRDETSNFQYLTFS